jgi:hypothetical protein
MVWPLALTAGCMKFGGRLFSNKEIWESFWLGMLLTSIALESWKCLHRSVL